MISVFPWESIYMYVEMNTSNKYAQQPFYIFTKERIWFKQDKNRLYYTHSIAYVLITATNCLLVLYLGISW